MEKKQYANGQKTYELTDNALTYFFKDGRIKAHGTSIDDVMKGEWKFYRESCQLWQVGNFRNGQKHGQWIRYDKNGQLEYQEQFENGKKIAKIRQR